MAAINVKEIARELQEVIKKYDEKSSYQSCLSAISRYYGYENWNTLSATLKNLGVEPNAAPKPTRI